MNFSNLDQLFYMFLIILFISPQLSKIISLTLESGYTTYNFVPCVLVTDFLRDYGSIVFHSP
jgi:hypothetical protein